MITIKIPRCRKIKFVPKLIYGNLTDPEVEDMIIHMWTGGSSYRDIKTFINRLYGTFTSLKLLHRIMLQVQKYVENFHHRQIDKSYDCIYVDGLGLKVKSKNGVQKPVLLGVLGQRKEKEKIIRETIDYRIAKSESEKSYRELFKSLKKEVSSDVGKDF